MRNCRLTVFFIWISGSPFVQHSVAICAILVEGNEEKFCEIYFEFGKAVQEQMLFKRFHIWSSSGPPVQWSGTIYAILNEGITGNIHVKLCEIWTRGSGDVV